MIPSLPERKTLNGKFSAYCEVCWLPVYCLWIDKEPHGGVCIHGKTSALDCPHSQNHAQLVSGLRKIRELNEADKARAALSQHEDRKNG